MRYVQSSTTIVDSSQLIASFPCLRFIVSTAFPTIQARLDSLSKRAAHRAQRPIHLGIPWERLVCRDTPGRQ